MIPVEYFHESFEYREEFVDGVLQGNVYWKYNENKSSRWNTGHAGKKVGAINDRGYYVTSLRYNGYKCQFKVHTIVWILHENRYPHKNMVMDHIDRNRINNLRKNLREINFYQNSLNSEPSGNKSSMYKGVRYKTHSKTWEMTVTKNQITVSKCNKDEIQAAILYNQEAIKIHGKEFVFLNDISMGYTNQKYPNMPRGWEPEKVAA